MLPNFDKDAIDEEKLFNNTQSALEFISTTCGTHLIESVSIGESVFQVFVFKTNTFNLICDSSKSGWSGISSMSFQFFTSSVYCSCVGTLKVLSGSDIFGDNIGLLDDNKYSLSKSIFMIPVQETLIDCLKESIDAVPIKIQMCSCVVPVESEVHDLLKGTSVQACIARYGVECVGGAYYRNENTIDYASVYKDFCKQEMLSCVWAPFHSFSQLYVNLGEILKSNTINRNDVRNLVVTADVIEIEDDVDLSYIENLVLGCRLLIAGKNGSVPNVKLSDCAYEAKKMYCGEMKGNCVFFVDGNVTKRQLVFGNIASSFKPSEGIVCYDDFFAGKFPIEVFFVDSDEPIDCWIKDSLKSEIQVLLSTASVSVSPNVIGEDESRVTAKEAYKCVNWIVKYTEEIVQSGVNNNTDVPPEISSLYVSAMEVMDKSVNPNVEKQDFIPNVPLLNYGTYDKSIQRLLELSEAYSNQIDAVRKEFIEKNKEMSKEYTQEKRDENIKNIAQFMIDQNKALALKEDDIAQCHKEIIESKEKTLKQLNEQEKNLSVDLSERFKSLENAKDVLSDAVQKEIVKQEIKAAISLIVTIGGGLSAAFMTFSYARGAFATGINNIDKTIRLAMAFNNFVIFCGKVVNGGYEIDSMVEYGSQKKDIDDKQVQAPSDLDWEIFLNEMTAQVKPLESICKSETALYIAALQNLVAVGKAYNNVREQQCQYEYDISVEESNKKIAEDQSKRLNQLSLNIQEVHWTPDEDYYTDLGMFDAILQQKENDVLLKLIEIARLQNDAMTYFYLSKPCSIKQFDIMAVRNLLASQEMGALSALESYPNPPTNLSSSVDIVLKDIPVEKLQDDLGFEFSIALNEPKFYTYARVRINYIDVRVNGVNTDTGKCHVKLVSLGSPVHDRGLQREVLSYKMVQKDWNVVYDIKTGKTISGTKPSEDWKKYYAKQTPFQTYRVSIPNTIENRNLVFNGKCTDVTIRFFVEAVYSEVYGGKMLKKSVLGNDAYSFLNDLQGQCVTDGWDVVSFISSDAINALWKSRWDKEVDEAYKGKKQFVQFIRTECVTPFGKKEFKTEIEMELLSPLLVFKPNSKTYVDIQIPIKKAIVKITYDGDTEENEYESTPDQPCYLLTQCSLLSFSGSVDKDGGVYINIMDGAFAVEGVVINPLINTNLCNAIADYIKKEELPPWFLGTIKYQAEEEYLKPKKFFFTTYCPQNEDDPAVLGIYILTTRDDPPSHGMRISWEKGWVVGKKCNTAVYFSSSLLWTKEIEPPFVNALGQMNVKGGDCPERMFVESRKLYEKVVPVKVGWEKNMHKENQTAVVNLPPNSIHLNLNMDGMNLSCNAEWSERFPYESISPNARVGDRYHNVSWDDLPFTCSFNTDVVPSIDKNTFEVSFPDITVNPTVTATPKKNKLLGLPLPGVDKNLANGAKNAIVRQLSGVKVQLKRMSMFAVSNLLFPEGRMLVPQKVVFPRDMVIAGVAEREYGSDVVKK